MRVCDECGSKSELDEMYHSDGGSESLVCSKCREQRAPEYTIPYPHCDAGIMIN